MGYTEERGMYHARLAVLASRVEKVLALHRPGALGNACRHCVCTWPCPTIRILNGEQP